MAEEKFHLVSSYAPTGDQPQAIAQLVEGVERGDRCQTLLGVTGSGKTFTMAKVIEKVQRPTLVLAHNKTLAAQLCGPPKENALWKTKVSVFMPSWPSGSCCSCCYSFPTAALT